MKDKEELDRIFGSIYSGRKKKYPRSESERYEEWMSEERMD